MTISIYVAIGSAFPSWLVYDETTLTLSGFPTSPSNYTIIVRAEDTKGGEASDELLIQVIDDPNFDNTKNNNDDQTGCVAGCCSNCQTSIGGTVIFLGVVALSVFIFKKYFRNRELDNKENTQNFTRYEMKHQPSHQMSL